MRKLDVSKHGFLWKGKPDLVNNYPAAKARLDGRMRRLRKDPYVKAAYKSFIQKFIDQSTVKLVTAETLAQMILFRFITPEWSQQNARW